LKPTMSATVTEVPPPLAISCASKRPVGPAPVTSALPPGRMSRVSSPCGASGRFGENGGVGIPSVYREDLGVDAHVGAAMQVEVSAADADLVDLDPYVPHPDGWDGDVDDLPAASFGILDGLESLVVHDVSSWVFPAGLATSGVIFASHGSGRRFGLIDRIARRPLVVGISGRADAVGASPAFLRSSRQGGL
jgi:hypothetical protein